MSSKNLLSAITLRSINQLKYTHCFFCNQKVRRGCFWDGIGFKGRIWDEGPYEPELVLIAICQECIPKLGMLAGIAQSEPSHLMDLIEVEQLTDEKMLSELILSYWQAIAGTRKELLNKLTKITQGMINKLDDSTTSNEELNSLNSQLKTLLDAEANRTEGAGWVYLMRRENGDYKIGLSGNVDRRLEQIKRDYPQVQLIHKIAVDDMRQAEAMLHQEFGDKRQDGEWFSLDPEDIELIIRRVRFEDGWFLERYANMPVDKDT